MKKTLKTLVAFIVAVLLLTGCAMREEVGIKVTSDSKLSLRMLIAMDDEMIDTYLTIKENPEYMQAEDPSDIKVKEHTDEERWAFLDSDEMKSETGDMDDFKKEKYEKDGYKGYLYTRELGTLDEISSTSATSRVNIAGGDSGDLENQILFIKSGDVYKSNMAIKSEASDTDLSQIKDLGGTIELNFVLDLPVKPNSSNADSTENNGKTLKWNLLGSSKNIEFEFDLKSGSSKDDKEDEKDPKKDEKEDKKDKKKSKESDDDEDEEKSNVLLYVGIGGGALLLVVIIAVVVASTSKKKNAANNMSVQQAPVMGPSMEQPVQQQPVQIAQPTNQPVDPNNQNPGQQ